MSSSLFIVRFYFFLLLIPCFFSAHAGGNEMSSGSPKDSIQQIEIIGAVTHKRDELAGSVVKVFEKKTLLVNKQLESDGKFVIHLDIEKLYEVEISNPGYQPKVFRLATHTWNSKETILPVEMFVDLFSKTELKKIKNPEKITEVTTLYYNPKLGYFENNEPRNFVLKERFKLMKERLKKRRKNAEKQKKKILNNSQLKLLKSRPDRLSKYHS